MNRSEKPALKFYDASTFWKLDWRALLADLPYVLFGILFSKSVANDEMLFRSLSPLHLLEIFVLVSLFLPLYFGFMYAKYKLAYPKIITRLVLLAALAGFMIQLLFIFQLNVRAMEAGTGEKYTEYFFALFSFFLAVLIPAMASGGYKLGLKTYSDRFLKPERQLANIFCVIFGISLFLVQFILFVGEERGMGLRWLVFFGEVTFSVYAANRLFVLMRFLKRKLDEKNKLHFFERYIENAFPFIITSVLLIWSQVATHAAEVFLNEAKNRPLLIIVLALIFSGVIPFRLYLLFNPPLRFLNLLAGIASFAFFLWSIS